MNDQASRLSRHLPLLTGDEAKVLLALYLRGACLPAVAVPVAVLVGDTGLDPRALAELLRRLRQAGQADRRRRGGRGRWLWWAGRLRQKSR